MTASNKLPLCFVRYTCLIFKFIVMQSNSYYSSSLFQFYISIKSIDRRSLSVELCYSKCFIYTIHGLSLLLQAIQPSSKSSLSNYLKLLLYYFILVQFILSSLTLIHIIYYVVVTTTLYSFDDDRLHYLGRVSGDLTLNYESFFINGSLQAQIVFMSSVQPQLSVVIAVETRSRQSEPHSNDFYQFLRELLSMFWLKLSLFGSMLVNFQMSCVYDL